MFARRIWVMNANGSDPRPLTDDPAYRDERPLWSGGGSQLLFVRIDEGEQVSLWLMPNEGGGNPQLVVRGLGPLPGPPSGWFGYYGHIAWDALFDWWQGPVGQE